MQKTREKVGLDKDDLTTIIADVLSLPHCKGHGKARQIVRAVQTALVHALQSGETVSISGLGIFKVRTRPARRCRVAYFFNLKGGFQGNPRIINLPPKRYVHFQPSKELLRTLNVSQHSDTNS